MEYKINKYYVCFEPSYGYDITAARVWLITDIKKNQGKREDVIYGRLLCGCRNDVVEWYDYSGNSTDSQDLEDMSSGVNSAIPLFEGDAIIKLLDLLFGGNNYE